MPVNWKLSSVQFDAAEINGDVGSVPQMINRRKEALKCGRGRAVMLRKMSADVVSGMRREMFKCGMGNGEEGSFLIQTRLDIKQSSTPNVESRFIESALPFSSFLLYSRIVTDGSST